MQRLVFPARDRRLDTGTDALRQTHGFIEIQVRGNHQKFLPAHAPGVLIGTQLLTQDVGEALQGVIPGRVTMGIVQGLEVIEIQHHHREGARPLAHRCGQPLDTVHHPAPREQPGQRILERQALELRGQAFALAHLVGQCAVELFQVRGLLAQLTVRGLQVQLHAVAHAHHAPLHAITLGIGLGQHAHALGHIIQRLQHLLGALHDLLLLLEQREIGETFRLVAFLARGWFRRAVVWIAGGVHDVGHMR